jgi:hypothetical protein
MQSQIQMRQIQQQKNQLMMPLIQQRMNEELFPMGEISENWLETMAEAIKKIQPYSVKANLKEFATLFVKLQDKNPKLSLNEFQIVANTLDVLSIEQVALGPFGYEALINETTALVAIWQKKIKIINEEVTIEVETKLQMERAAAKGLSVAKE